MKENCVESILSAFARTTSEIFSLDSVPDCFQVLFHGFQPSLVIGARFNRFRHARARAYLLFRLNEYGCYHPEFFPIVFFYDALCENESAINELGDETLKKIAQELVVMLRKNTSIDWTLKESVRAKLRVYVKKLLNKYKYPPDKQEQATKTVLEQAEILCKNWTGEEE